MKTPKIHVLRQLAVAVIKVLQKKHRELARYDWTKQARPSQRVPKGKTWRIWLILAGRGFGKTRTGAETIRAWVASLQYKRIALIGNTEKDVRQVMIEGESGLLNIYPPDEKPPIFFPSQGQVRWPNGAIATIFTAEAYEKLRGPQFDAAWVDELAKFREPDETWDQLMLTLRLGNAPRAIVTTTPKPIPLIQKLLKDKMVKVTRGSTYDNKANLAPSFLDQIVKRYDNTKLGAQEVHGEMLSETEGALWQRDLIQYQEVDLTQLTRIVIAVDPAVTNKKSSDETGIIVAGRDDKKRAYILSDGSGRFRPNQWGQKIIEFYKQFQADRVIVEVNQGGDMIEHIVRTLDENISFKAVRATRGKHIRAEPVVALYEQGRIFHSQPFGKLESQMCSFQPGAKGPSPDRMDALVWAVTDLLLTPEHTPFIWRI